MRKNRPDPCQRQKPEKPWLWKSRIIPIAVNHPATLGGSVRFSNLRASQKSQKNLLTTTPSAECSEMLLFNNRTPSTPGKHYPWGSLHRCGEAFFRSRIAAAQRPGLPGSGVLRVGIPGPEKTIPGFAKGSDAVAPHSRTRAGKHPPWLIPPSQLIPPQSL
jgi:hypothetical protein